MIPFNRPPRTGLEDKYILEAINSDKMSGDGRFSNLCEAWFEKNMATRRALLTPSCTQALEMAAILIGIEPGDEVIMPSYTFVSTANAFVLRGAKIVFVDIDPATMNIDAQLIDGAITSRTKAIVPVHYAGVACDMGAVMEIAAKNGLWVVEDAAQAMGTVHSDKHLGTIGHLGAFSFHETKNYTSGGEGGLLLVNDPELVERAEIIREKGTNRRAFFKGQVDKYTWVDVGSSYLPSEIQAAYLWGQLEAYNSIAQDRIKTWNFYRKALSENATHGLGLPPEHEARDHNAHMFFVKTSSFEERTRLIRHLSDQGVMGVFHYVPLHTAPAGLRFGRFHGRDIYTTSESSKLVRLPLWYGMSNAVRSKVVDAVCSFAS
ncbi:dTDP-4-amino-4,6-dideoxygalactose transaminase [Cryobacterium sp. PH31-AA6]|uniref:dTDP-4-amino-4,6-dideoxygalactose transaminase n=1 Tax=Cryobacterium sp. PH31-AA6 TaxID=3046205 RepID=UPI0024BA5B2F|nr:dTDP-4-amino-4,6-dideoxygalactose transaminase [Cryobacterium sp. PH31-AA6]MDJ0323890.1 dTDP-4-amino-4,6-dideoxygalactose transaminase [Cryobacterium sp. PH31-AA6]